MPRILVFPSLCEGLGLLPLEAAMSGCVVVAFDTGPMSATLPPEYVHRVDDFQSMVRVIEEVCAENSMTRHWEEVSCRFQRRVRNSHSLEAEAESILHAWRELLANMVDS